MKESLSVKNIIGSFFQIILAVIVFPICCLLASGFYGADQKSQMIFNVLSELEMSNYWFDTLSILLDSSTIMTAVETTNRINNLLSTTIFEALIVGMCVSIFKNLGLFLRIPGIPLMQYILGVFSSCILIRFFDISPDISAIFITSALILLNMLIIWFLPNKNYICKLLAIFLGLALQVMFAMYTVIYLNLLICILKGYITSFTSVLAWIGSIFLPMLVLVLLDFIFLTPITKKLGID